jgi:hypothetical protein
MNTTLLILAGVALLSLIAIVLSISVLIRLRNVFRGKKAESLEVHMEHLGKMVDHVMADQENTSRTLSNHDKRLKTSLRGVHMLRYNPFEDSGSNQSFAIALLDEEENGVVMTGLYSRERMSVFAKPVAGGTSEYELTNEENHALGKAKEKVTK